MKILVTGDTHGSIERVVDICSKLKNIDLIIHCGDHYSDGEEIENRIHIPVIAVQGNCDYGEGPLKRAITTPDGKIIVVHGHNENCDLMRLTYMAEEDGAEAVCFGHTHVAGIESLHGVQLINPGSLSRPRDGSGGTFAVIISEDGNMTANIVRYETLFGGEKKKPKKGRGRISSAFNYSDRF